MTISSLFDQGSSAVAEDGHYARLPFLVVTDGFSEPHCRLHPWRKFRGRMSGGELISRLTEHFFAERSLDKNALDLDLRELIMELNSTIRTEFEISNLPLDDAGQLPAAFFAIAKINERERVVEIVQVGDCLALWIEENGNIGITPDQTRRYVNKRYDEILWLQQKIAVQKYGTALEKLTPEQHQEVVAEMWVEFHPILEAVRREHTNNPKSAIGFGALSGQPELEKMIFYRKFPLEKLTDLVLFTDGMTPPMASREKSDEEILQEFGKTYKEGGISKLYEEAVKTESSTEKINYTVGEKTAVAIKFSS